MTVYIEKPSLNLREELASLRNQGGYEEQQFWMDGLVTNGTFDTDTNWTKGTGWTISGGTANGATATASLVSAASIGYSAHKTYAVTFTVTSYTSGTVRSNLGANVNGAIRSATGTYTDYLTPSGGDGKIYFVVSSFVGSIDNVSVFEVDANDDVVHRMPKGWVPKDVYEDGLLQREGAANDYEVVYDGFDYYVKPAVAPSATTQTCVIGVRK